MDVSSFRNIRNLKFSDESGYSIDLIADIDGVGDNIPFTADDADPESYGHEIYAAAVNGIYGPVAPYTPPEVTPEMYAQQARRQRDNFLKITDHFVITDYTINDVYLSEEQRQELFSVRLSFKQWPKQPGWPDIPFPDIPQWIADEIINTGYALPVWPV